MDEPTVNDLLEVRNKLQELSEEIREQRQNKNPNADMYLILKSLKDQIGTMNSMTTTILSQANDNYARVEKKVDDNNYRLDMFQAEIQSFTSAITQLTMKLEIKVSEQDSKIEKIESAFGHITGEWCGVETKTFCEELKKNEEPIKHLISKEIGTQGAIKTIKQGLFTNIGSSLLSIIAILLFLLTIGSLVFVGAKIDDIKKAIPIVKSITPN
jgi:chromosome segregation ATPase